MSKTEILSESEINPEIVSMTGDDASIELNDDMLSEIETTIIPKSFVGSFVSGISTMFDNDPKIVEDSDNDRSTIDIMAATVPGIVEPITNVPEPIVNVPEPIVNVPEPIVMAKESMLGGARDMSFAEKYHMYKEAYYLLKDSIENGQKNA